MDLIKVAGVANWKTPKNVRDIRKFLGFINFYQHFIPNHSKKAKPMNDLCYVFVGLWTVSSLSVLSPPISIHFPYHTQIASDCLVPFTYLPITPISDPPLSYPVALCLSPYQWLFPYLPVRYIDSQSGGTAGLGLCPLRLVTLLARVPQQYIRMYS